MPELNIFHRLKRRQKEKRGRGNDEHEREPTEELFSTAGAYGLKTVAEGEHDTAE
jgi:hypothetical protein